MGTQFQATACPLCHDAFEDPVDYRDHLAMVHDLVDDEGTETGLAEAEPEPEPEPALEPVAAPAPPIVVVSTPHLSAETAAALTGSVDVRVDRRVLPGLVIAVAVQLVVALLGLAIVGGDSGDKTVETQALASEQAHSAPSGNAGATGATQASTAPPTTAAPAPDTHNDQARAELITPRASDFPAGWSEVDPAALDDSGSADASALDDCSVPNDPTDDPALPSAETALAHDASFAFGGGVVLKNEADALQGMTILRQISNCLGNAVATETSSGLPRGVSVTHGSFSSLGFSTYGDESMALSMPMTFVGPGGSVPLRVDLLAVRHDRALVFMLAIVGANDFTPAQERATLSAVADRMRPASI